MNRNQTNLGIALLLSTLCTFISCKKHDYHHPGNYNYKDVYFYALTNTNELVKYSGRQTFEEEETVAVTGLQPGEKILAIDFRPASGQLYGVSSQSRIYIINQNTGTSVAVSMTPFSPVISGTAVGFDFNPTVDRIRLVTNNGQNIRLNPETGTVAATDGNLNPGTPNVVAVAYTNSIAGAATTTLFDIDAASDKLFMQNPPNDGTLSEVGPLGINAEGEGGFDISNESASGIAVLYGRGHDDKDDDQFDKTGSNGSGYRFYHIDLQTGKAKYAGKAKGTIIGLAIPTPPVAYSITGGTNLLIINPFNPGAGISKPITGLQSGESVWGIDMRPANGQLFALGSTSRIYTINASSGVAAAVGSGFVPMLSGTQFGFDFNPTVDRIRVVSNNGQNLRLNPMTGAAAAVDGALNPGSPMVDAAAYANNFAGATTTTLFDIDYGNDALFTQTPPNDGTLSQVGSLGVNADAGNGFDIGGTSGKAYAILRTGNSSGIYSINLSSGTATKLSNFSNTANGFAIGLGF